MAIIIEDDKRRPSIVPILIWLIVIGVVLAAAYYLFFNQPELIPLPTPANLENTDALANIQFDPQEIVPQIQALTTYVAEPSSTADIVGRTNPFLPY
jgi:hypothetical protein